MISVTMFACLQKLTLCVALLALNCQLYVHRARMKVLNPLQGEDWKILSPGIGFSNPLPAEREKSRCIPTHMVVPKNTYFLVKC